MKSLSRVLFWWGDVFADSLYACDVCVQLRTAYRDDQGIMVRDVLNVLRSLLPSQLGRSQDFSKGGGGGHTGSNNIVMAFSPRNIVGCLLKKRLTKGGGVTGTPGPSPPQLRPCTGLEKNLRPVVWASNVSCSLAHLQGSSVRVMENLESRVILQFHFPGLESHKILVWVMESPGK